MHRLLKSAAVPVLAGSIVVGISGAAGPPTANPPVARQPQSGTSDALYRHEGNNATLIPPATGEHKVLYPFLIGPAPTVTYAAESVADSGPVKVAVGDQIVLVMTGEVAKDYNRRSGAKTGDVASIETTATVTRPQKDGQFTFEHHGPVKRAGQPETLVTLSGVVDQSKLTRRITPRSTPIYTSPKDAKYTVANYEIKTTVLSLSELDGLKLRTWTLTEDSAK